MQGVTVQTDDYGSYEVILRAGFGAYRVYPHFNFPKPNTWLAFLGQDIRLDTPTKEVALMFDDPVTLQLLVVDLAGRPIEGARAQFAYGDSAAQAFAFYSDASHPESNAEGRVLFNQFMPGQPIKIRNVTQPEYVASQQFLYSGQPGEVIQDMVILYERAAIAGRILDSAGDPLVLREISLTAYYGDDAVIRLDVETDELGFFASEYELPATDVTLSLEVDIGADEPRQILLENVGRVSLQSLDMGVLIFQTD